MTAALLVGLAVTSGMSPTATATVGAGLVTTWGWVGVGDDGPPASLDTTGAVAVAAAAVHSLALTPEGRVVAWGEDWEGETDVPLSLVHQQVTAISAGGLHSLALTSDGHVTAWGYGEWGENDVPTALSEKMVTAIDAGGTHNLALTSDGHVTAWGEDAFGETDVPASLAKKRVTAISAGQYFSLALTSDGQVTAWGYEGAGDMYVPASLSGKTVTAISAGSFFNLALTSDGQITAWGDRSYPRAHVPTSLAGKMVTAISAGGVHGIALTSDGEVTTWGSNEYGQLDVPASLSGRTVTAIAAGGVGSTVLTEGVAPVVTSSPASADVQPGAAATLTAAASGKPTPTVQWQRADPGGEYADVHGATGTSHTFTPSAGDDGATFRAVFTNSAGSVTTSAATVTVLNSAPTVRDVDVTAGFEAATPVTLLGSDPDDDTLIYVLVRQPKHGTLSGRAPRLTYTPDDGYDGGDSFTYRANDGNFSSSVAKVSIIVSAQSCLPPTPRRQLTVSADHRDTNGVIRSPKLKTKKSGELLIAFVSVGGPVHGAQSVTGVTGGGLTWTLVQRENTVAGASEIWQAYAAKKLRSTRITAHLASPGHTVTLTVAGFSGARPAAGAAARASGSQSAPRVSLTPQTSGSVVWAVGRVVGSRYDPAPPSGQKVVHDQTFTAPAAGYWTQRVIAPSTAGHDVTVSGDEAAETWGYAAVEIRGTCG